MGQSGAQSKSRQLPLIPQQHRGERVLEKDGGETKASPLWGGVGGKSASDCQVEMDISRKAALQRTGTGGSEMAVREGD